MGFSDYPWGLGSQVAGGINVSRASKSWKYFCHVRYPQEPGLCSSCRAGGFVPALGFQPAQSQFEMSSAGCKPWNWEGNRNEGMCPVLCSGWGVMLTQLSLLLYKVTPVCLLWACPLSQLLCLLPSMSFRTDLCHIPSLHHDQYHRKQWRKQMHIIS